MELLKNNTLLVSICTLILGGALGFGAGHRGERGGEGEWNARDEDRGNMMHSDERANTSPAMQHNTEDMHSTMNDMKSSLDGKEGDALDKAFLDGMIVHHEGAVDMASTLLKGTHRPELIEMGKNIISAQTKEITQMKAWRASWFPSTTTPQ